jgi:hypothetical protein
VHNQQQSTSKLDSRVWPADDVAHASSRSQIKHFAIQGVLQILGRNCPSFAANGNQTDVVLYIAIDRTTWRSNEARGLIAMPQLNLNAI